MRMLLFFLAVSVVVALRADRRDELPRSRWIIALIVIVSTGYLSQTFI